MLETVFFFLLVGAAILGFVQSPRVRAFLVTRRLSSAKSYSTAELPERVPGRVVGIAQALGETLTAPLTGRACVYYEVRVVDRNKGGSRAQLIREVRGVPFVLLDGGVRAIVDPEHAELAIDVDVHTTSGTFDNPTSTEAALLARHSQRSQGWIFNRVLRYDEAVISIGETVSVLGIGVREPDPEAVPTGYREAPKTRIRLSGSSRFPLLISDKPSTTK